MIKNIGGVPPFLLKTGDNRDGVDGGVFEGIKKAVAKDRYAFFTEFFNNPDLTAEEAQKRFVELVGSAT